jgi:acyl carrier protein
LPAFSTTPTPETLTAWLAERLAVYTEMRPEEIQPDIPMASYGLDSVNVVAILVEIEDELGCALEPNVPWEYPTIEALTGYLIGEVQQRSQPDAQGG